MKYQSRMLPNTRIDVADALRGLAVAGIILYHSVEHFNIFGGKPVHALASDRTVFDALTWLLSGKMYGIFALLFGLSFFIMNDNRQQKGKPFAGRFAWRMLLLFGFGVINMSFYDGDILTFYAIFGLFLIPCSFLPNAAVWAIIAFLAIQPVELFSLISGHHISTAAMGKFYGAMGQAHTSGTIFDVAAANLKYGFLASGLWFVAKGRITQTIMLFLLGMQLGRHRLFYNEGNNLKIWRGICAASVALVIVGSLFEFGKLNSWLHPIYNLFILLMIVSGVVLLWYRFGGFRKAMGHLGVFGRMSLTNYLLSSIIGGFIFNYYGLDGCHQIGETWCALVGVGIILVQYTFCRLWALNHDRGPAETLWRKLTWINNK